MKKNVVTTITLCLMVLFFGGCSSVNSLVAEKIDPAKVDRIQVVLAGGTPELGQESKIISDEEEIAQIIDAINAAQIGKIVEEMDIVIADTSRYYLYCNDTLLEAITFNGNDSNRVWYDNNYYYVEYENKTLYELFNASTAPIIIVDEELNQMESIN